jgi:hypothetical protein
MTTHHIKIWQRWFDAVASGDKTFEIRRDDRDYKVGDTLVLEEYRQALGEYTGRKLTRIVSYVYRRRDGANEPFADAIAPDYCVLGIKGEAVGSP